MLIFRRWEVIKLIVAFFAAADVAEKGKIGGCHKMPFCQFSSVLTFGASGLILTVKSPLRNIHWSMALILHPFNVGEVCVVP